MKGHLVKTSNSILIKRLRRRFRSRDEHHTNCSSRRDGRCDCYNINSAEAHELLDELERRLQKGKGKS